MTRRLLTAALVAMFIAPAALAQQGGRPTISIAVTQDDVAPRYIAEGHQKLRGVPNVEPNFFLLDMAYNLKLWHLAMGRTVTCNGQEYPVRSIQVEGLHVHDGGAKAVLYYGAEFDVTGRPAGGAKDEICRSGSLMLPMEKLADEEWYVPSWGLRLVKRR